KRSDSFPYSGTVTVDVTRYAVTTHERWSSPWRSATILGSAVATIVWSSAANSIPSSAPLNGRRSSRRPTASTYLCAGPSGGSGAAREPGRDEHALVGEDRQRLVAARQERRPTRRGLPHRECGRRVGVGGRKIGTRDGHRQDPGGRTAGVRVEHVLAAR